MLQALTDLRHNAQSANISLKDLAFNSLQDRICLQNSIGGGGGGGANPFSAIRLLVGQFSLKKVLCSSAHFFLLRESTYTAGFTLVLLK